jgi:hypothetical protein
MKNQKTFHSSVGRHMNNPVQDEVAVRGMDETPLQDWLDNQSVMHLLHISPRTLLTLRNNGTLPYSRIGNKIYYKRSDINKILSKNYNYGNK